MIESVHGVIASHARRLSKQTTMNNTRSRFVSPSHFPLHFSMSIFLNWSFLFDVLLAGKAVNVRNVCTHVMLTATEVQVM